MPDDAEGLLQDMIRALQNQRVLTGEPSYEGLYLLAENGQYLGEVTTNRDEETSLLNSYGPYGSRYSDTSIFNPYSEYGSRYGANSVNNPYASLPPKLYRAGRAVVPVSKNPYISDRVDADVFTRLLHHDVDRLLAPGGLAGIQGISGIQGMSRGHLEAQDGRLLGSLKPDRYDSDSVFNTYGPYGSKYSGTSIFNPYSPYGDRYSNLSARNPRATNPPRALVEGEFRAFVTINLALTPRIAPDELLKWAERHVRRW